MVAFNFKREWTSLVEDGIKRQTVRASLRAEVGDTLQLYTGQRTKACRKLRADVVCAGVSGVTREPGRFFVDDAATQRYLTPFLDMAGGALFVGAADFALLDGFGEDVAACAAFFRSGFTGWLYRWDVPVLRWSADQWLFVYTGRLRTPFDSSYRARSGRLYGVGSQDGAGDIGLMRGIPADWVEV